MPKEGWEQPCALCGQPIRDGAPDLEIEKSDEVTLGGGEHRRVWHKGCFEQFLDMNEET
ncbi:MAG: hypothetical protein ACREI3_08485 [Nitrospirales bacterium]